MADAESISLEETNKIRISLGLKPLQPESEKTVTKDEDGNVILTADDEERQGVENLKALRAEQAKVAEEEALKRRLKKAKDRKALNEKLAGRTLGEADEEEETDLKAWIKKTKKRERELAAKRAQELENQDKLFQDEYTSEQLEGLRVGHDFEDIEEGEGVILTIKDKGVLDDDDDGDELISTALAEKERLKEHLGNKIKKPKYDPYAEEYDDDTGEKKLLAKYDDEEEAKRKKAFVLGKDQPTSKFAKPTQSTISSNLVEISLDYDKPTEITSDYVDPSTIKIKKPKKKKGKMTTSVAAILDDDGLLPNAAEDGMAEEYTSIPLSTVKRSHNEDSGFGDDEELQAMLAQRRRQAQKKRKVTQPEDIVRNLRQYTDQEEQVFPEGGLVLDDTSEFVRGIEMTQQETPTERRRPSQSNMEVDTVVEPEDVEMVDADGDVREGSVPKDTTANGLDDEQLIAAGSMAATLAALKRTGQLGQTDVPSHFTVDESQRREEILARQRLRKVEQEEEARRQREQERENERFKRMSQRERELHREQVNQARERAEAQRRMQEFNEFKFNVDVEYKDEFGEEMSKKDAFKRLSHAFHGKGSGTMKKGKYLQNVLAKKKLEKGSTVNELEKYNQQREKQKSLGSAHTRIQ